MKKRNKIIGIIIGILFLFGNILSINATSAAISVTSNSSKVVIGNTVTVTVKISSSTPLGSWEWTIDYDSSKLKLTSGEVVVADAGDGSTKSKSYTYSFKTIGTGTTKVSVKSSGALQYSDTEPYSLSVGSKSITIITKSEQQASLSSNSNLGSLSVGGYQLSPDFNKETLDYSVEVPSSVEKVNIIGGTEDSKASAGGFGEKDVAEGENSFQIVVTAENGTTKTYNIIINVKDENPIEVIIDKEKYTVVKRISSLVCPTNFESKEITINNITVPSCYSELNNYYLVGLKNTSNEVNTFIYNSKNNTYTPYSETKLSQLLLQPLPMDKAFDTNLYSKTTITINDIKYEAYKIKNSKYAIVHARELTTGEDDYYLYDSVNNTAIKYNSEESNIYKAKSIKYYKVAMVLGIESILVVLILFILLIVSIIKKNKKRKLLKEKINKEKEELVKDISDIKNESNSNDEKIINESDIIDKGEKNKKNRKK